MERGTSGTPVRVQTNAFKITRLPRNDYYHYNVIIQRNVRNRATGQNEDKTLLPGQRYTEIIDKMQVQYSEQFVPRAAYDGLYNLYSPQVLAATRFDVTLEGPGDRRSVFHVQLAQVARVDTRIFNYLTSPNGAAESGHQRPDASATAINLLQVLISQSPHIKHNFSLHAKSFYNHTPSGGARDIVRGLQAVSGIFQSVRPVLGSFIVNVDTTTAAFYKYGPLVNVAMAYMGYKDVRRFIVACQDPTKFDRLRRFLKGVAVIIRKERRRVIKDLIVEAGPYEFEKGDRHTTVEEHYWEAYQERLHHPYFFGVMCGDGDVFPADVCEVPSGQRYRRKLDPDQTAEFLKVSVKDPTPRFQAIQEAVRGDLLGYGQSPWMLDAGMAVDQRPLEIDARQLPPPTVQYGKNASADMSRAVGAWNVVGRKLYAPVTINAWAVVNFDNARPEEINNLINMLHRSMRNLGMTVPGPNDVVIEIGNLHDPEASLMQAGSRMFGRLRPDEQQAYARGALWLVILPQSGLELRKKVKYWGDVLRGVATQCVRAPKYKQGLNDQYCNNVAIKINSKLGGVNTLPVSDDIVKTLSGAMVVGCDVSHPSPGVNDRPSLASVVTSYNSTATKYTVLLDCQRPRQEIIERMAGMLQSGLITYCQYNKRFPSTVYIYRDGVSDGEYWQVMKQEIKEIKVMLEDFARERGASEPIKLVFIAVGKRHHIRFFPTSPHGRDRKGNALPGLVVDSGVVHSTLPDFYLQSHAGLIGTSRPSHYVVLHNEPGLTVDDIQKLSYHLCYFYAVATRAVSIPAPVYYADRACSRAAYQFEPNPELGEYDHDSTADAAHSFEEAKLNDWRTALKQSKQSDRLYFL